MHDHWAVGQFACVKTYPNPMVYHHFSKKNGMGSIQGQVSTRLVEQAYGFQFLGHKGHKLFTHRSGSTKQ